MTQSNLTIEGVGGTPIFNDNGYTIPNQKGIFDIKGNNVTVENITFEYAHDLTGRIERTTPASAAKATP